MKREVNKIIDEFLDFSGEKTPSDFTDIMKRVKKLMQKNANDLEAVVKLAYVQQKLEHGLEMAKKYGEIMAVVLCTPEDIQEFFENFRGKHTE
jgi:hypothetical protein